MGCIAIYTAGAFREPSEASENPHGASRSSRDLFGAFRELSGALGSLARACLELGAFGSFSVSFRKPCGSFPGAFWSHGAVKCAISRVVINSFSSVVLSRSRSGRSTCGSSKMTLLTTTWKCRTTCKSTRQHRAFSGWQCRRPETRVALVRGSTASDLMHMSGRCCQDFAIDVDVLIPLFAKKTPMKIRS